MHHPLSEEKSEFIQSHLVDGVKVLKKKTNIRGKSSPKIQGSSSRTQAAKASPLELCSDFSSLQDKGEAPH